MNKAEANKSGLWGERGNSSGPRENSWEMENMLSVK